jgi:16S rRNA (guanine966-N2)-methyltransferase
MLRITSGIYRGRMIATPSGNKTRPTQARLRQALLNSLQSDLPGAKVLDLFAGSGALGFESLSRGAERVTFVESARGAAGVIQQNAKILKVESQVSIQIQSVETFLGRLERSHAPFDLIFADPPYEEGWEMKLLERVPWESWLAPGGSFCLEWGIQKSLVQELPERVHCLVKQREKLYGDSVLTTYVRE